MLQLAIPLAQIEAFFLIFLRISGLVFTVPIIGSKTVPVTVKAGFSIALSFALFATVRQSGFSGAGGSPAWFLGAVSELLMGLAIGLSVRLLFAGVQMAGQMVGYQMGLAIANIMDPASSAQIPVLSQMYNLIAMLLFVTLNVHHWFIRGLVESYALIPPMGTVISGAAVQLLVDTAGGLFVVAVQIGAPVMVVLLISSVAFGLVARTVPQMNIFIVAMPMKIMAGLVFVGLSLPFLVQFLTDRFGRWPLDLMDLLRAMSGGG